VLDPQLLAFTAIAAVITVIPGVDMALVARNVLTHGRRAGYITSLGICCGFSIHAVASALGLSAILMVSATLFAAVKLTGALYLIGLGLLSLRAAFMGGHESDALRTVDARRAFVQGFLSNLLNPKIVVFYLTLLPQFVRPEDSVLARSLLLAGIHAAMGLVWLVIYSYFLGRLSAMFRRPRIRRVFEGVTGAALVGLGARLAWERR